MGGPVTAEKLRALRARAQGSSPLAVPAPEGAGSPAPASAPVAAPG